MTRSRCSQILNASAKSSELQGLVGETESYQSVNTDQLQLFGNSSKTIAFRLKYRHLSALTILEIDKKQHKEMKQECRLWSAVVLPVGTEGPLSLAPGRRLLSSCASARLQGRKPKTWAAVLAQPHMEKNTGTEPHSRCCIHGGSLWGQLPERAWIGFFYTRSGTWVRKNPLEM